MEKLLFNAPACEWNNEAAAGNSHVRIHHYQCANLPLSGSISDTDLMCSERNIYWESTAVRCVYIMTKRKRRKKEKKWEAALDPWYRAR